MGLEIMLALIAVTLKTGCSLRTDANSITDFDAILHVFANSDGFSNDFVSDNDRIICWKPAAF